MINVTTGERQAKDQPVRFSIYSREELRSFLVSNCHLVNRCLEKPHEFVVVRIHDLRITRVLFAKLVREVFNENTNHVTFLPTRRMMYIHFAPQLNWIPEVKSKVMNIVRSTFLMAEEDLESPKDKWGELLVTSQIVSGVY